jgi:hypothetical protein
LDPSGCESHPLRTVVVAGQRSQFFEFIDSPLGIQGAAHVGIVLPSRWKKSAF